MLSMLMTGSSGMELQSCSVTQAAPKVPHCQGQRRVRASLLVARVHADINQSRQGLKVGIRRVTGVSVGEAELSRIAHSRTPKKCEVVFASTVEGNQ